MDHLQHNMLYSCTEQRKRGHEQFVEEHALGYIAAGEVHFFINGEMRILKQGTVGLIHRNQFARSVKVPPQDGSPFKAINIMLTQKALKAYAGQKELKIERKYTGDKMLELSGNVFIMAYFNSLLPYFDQPDMLSAELASLKTNEAIALILQHKPELTSFLFDFSQPYKIDLEAFMNRNYTYHVPMSQFAQMTGRSLATFKRDFTKVFADAPEKWLREKRLEHAHFLLKQRKTTPGDACYESGFENLSHFSSSFKSHYGYSPSSLLREGNQ